MTDLEKLVLRFHELLGELEPRLEELAVVRARIAELTPEDDAQPPEQG